MEPSTSFLFRFSCAFNFLITPSDTYKATTPVKPITGSRNPSPTKTPTGSKTPFWTPYTHWGRGATDMETGTHALLTDWLQLSASMWNLPLGGSQEQCRSMIVKPRPVLFDLMSIKRAFLSPPPDQHQRYYRYNHTSSWPHCSWICPHPCHATLSPILLSILKRINMATSSHTHTH